MAPLPVPSLLDIALRALQDMVGEYSSQTVSGLNKTYRKVLQTLQNCPEEERQEYKMLAQQESHCQLCQLVTSFGAWLQGHVVHYLEPQVSAAVLGGLDMATRRYKATWSHTTDNREFTRFLFGIVKFCEVIAVPSKKHLLLDEVPQIMRNHLYTVLPRLPNLTRLNLGSGSGGSCTTAFEAKFLVGIPYLVCLREFTLRYDCSVRILSALATSCCSSLRVLDMERSREVGDESVSQILCFQKLQSLSIFGCAFTEQGQVLLLLGLPLLQELPRGDFLCDALEWLQEEQPGAPLSLRLGLKGFWASEEYFFHHSSQIKLVCDVCPDIARMLFMFRNTESTFRDLQGFSNLKELDLWGGDFYTDEFFLLLPLIGPQLTQLTLVHVDELDSQAITILSQNTQNLRSLTFSSCGFQDMQEGRENRGFQQLDRERRREEELTAAAYHWMDLEKLKITSEISISMLVRIVRGCLGLVTLSLGMHTGLTDTGLKQIMANNSLQHLQHFKCTQSEHLTIQSVHLLMFSCPALITCLSLDSWAISPTELKEFETWVRKSNIQLRTTEEKDEMEEMPGVASNLPENGRARMC